MYVQTEFSAHIVKANIKGIECGIQLLSLRSKCLDSANQPTRKRDTCFDSILKTPREYLELMAVRKQGILVPCMLAVGLTWSAHRLAPSSPSSSSYVFLPLSLFLFPSLFSLHLFIITRPLALSFSLSLSQPHPFPKGHLKSALAHSFCSALFILLLRLVLLSDPRWRHWKFGVSQIFSLSFFLLHQFTTHSVALILEPERPRLNRQRCRHATLSTTQRRNIELQDLQFSFWNSIVTCPFFWLWRNPLGCYVYNT